MSKETEKLASLFAGHDKTAGRDKLLQHFFNHLAVASFLNQATGELN